MPECSIEDIESQGILSTSLIQGIHEARSEKREAGVRFGY